jgi:hypothetical protein
VLNNEPSPRLRLDAECCLIGGRLMACLTPLKMYHNSVSLVPIFVRAITMFVWSAAAFSSSVASGAASGKEVYITDMSRCMPASSLASSPAQGKWRTMQYSTGQLSGSMLWADSYINAPDVTFPLNMQGWYAIYIGFWSPDFVADDRPYLKLKLSDEPAFRKIWYDSTPDTQNVTYLREFFLENADLTGRDLVIGKSNGLVGSFSNIAFIHLVPLSAEKVNQILLDRKRTDTRNLTAVIDGMSFAHYAECDTPEQVLEEIEPYRYSDVGKVIWAVNYGSTTNYPAHVEGAEFMGGPEARARFVQNGGSTDYTRGERQWYDSLGAFAAKGIFPQQIAAKGAHEMGLKFDLMFRLGIFGGAGVGPLPSNEHGYVQTHPEYRLVMRDGSVLSGASYAFPEVRQFMLDLIRDATQRTDADGINLCFVRGPHFLLYEQPILTAFSKEYHLDARSVKEDDPRLLKVRSSFMTEFTRDARSVLDDVGKKKGKHLELSVWAWPSDKNVWMGGTPLEEGLDIKSWIKEGLLDSVICQGGIDAGYIELGKAHNCQFQLFTGYSGAEAMSPDTVTKAYKAGVENFAYWDMDLSQINPSQWNWIRRIGHENEMADWDHFAPTHDRLIPLRTVNQVDVFHGLAQAVYAGG